MEKTMKMIAKNNKAYFDYEIHETHETGIVLSGAEVKSIRLGRVNMKGSHVVIMDEAPYILNLHISAYQPGNQPDYDPTKRRKLLMKKKEISYLAGASEQAGLTLIPLQIIQKGGLIKMQIGLCRGRKKYDKRQVIKKRDQMREIRKNVL